MNIFQRWKAPTPLFFKKVFRISLIAAAGAAALYAAPALVGAMPGGFKFTLLPVTELICKNVIVAGLVSAAVAKAAKEDKATP